MKKLFCREVLFRGCSYVAEGKSKSEAINNFIEHGFLAHTEVMANNPSIGDNFIEKAKNSIYDF